MTKAGIIILIISSAVIVVYLCRIIYEMGRNDAFSQVIRMIEEMRAENGALFDTDRDDADVRRISHGEMVQMEREAENSAVKKESNGKEQKDGDNR